LKVGFRKKEEEEEVSNKKKHRFNAWQQLAQKKAETKRQRRR
jgi:hypothetical protein